MEILIFLSIGRYAMAAPVTGDYVFLGEIKKYVPASTFRFQSVTPMSSGFKVEMVFDFFHKLTKYSRNVCCAKVGASNETVSVCVATTSDMSIKCTSVHFEEKGSQTVNIP